MSAHPPMSVARRRWLAGGVALTAAAGGAWLAWEQTRSTTSNDAALEAFWQLQLQQPEGGVLSLASLRGQPLLVNFWATSCVTCVAEMPEVIATYNKYKDQGYDTLAVAMQYDPPSYVVNFAQSRQLPFKVALDNTGQIAKDWGDVKLTPTTYIVNKRGDIVKTYIGQPNFEELHQLIEKLLAEA